MSGESVLLRVGNVYTTIVAKKTVVEELSKVFAYEVAEADRIRSYKVDFYISKGRLEDAKKWAQWDGKFSLVYRNSIGSGFAEDVYMYLLDSGYDVSVIDAQTTPNKRFDVGYSEEASSVVLYTYQEEALESLREMQYRGILHMATASGKTVMALELIKRVGGKTVVFATRKELIRQWARRIEESYEGVVKEKLNGVEAFVFYLGDEPFLLLCTPLLIKSAIENKSSNGRIKQRNEVVRGFFDADLVVFDEAHRSSSSESKRALRRIKAPARVGLTATANAREDNTDYEYLGLLGNTSFFFSPTELVGVGKGSVIDIHILPIKISRENMSFYYSLRRDYAKLYEAYVVNGEERNSLIVAVALSEIVDGKSVLVLVDRIAHAERIAALLGDSATYTSSKDKERKDKIDRFRKGEVKCLVCTHSLIGEGFDFPELEVLVIGGGKSEIKVKQSVGRLMRKKPVGKTAVLYDFADTISPFDDHLRSRVRIYESEKAFNIVEKPRWLTT